MATPYKLKFSPSHSERWMNCPGSPRLVAEIPPEPSSIHAAQGTAAHALAAECLTRDEDAQEWVGEELETKDGVYKVTPAMADAVQVYLDAIREDLDANGIPHTELAIETPFQIENIACLKGTNDASFSSPLGKLYVYDYKHGEGKYVEVIDNTQLLIYALGAMERAGWVNDTAELVIVQPRYNREDVAKVRRWEISADDLRAFKVKVREGIDRCMDPLAPFVPGYWCGKTFCPAFGVCPGVRKKAVAVVDENSTALVFPNPAKLTPEQIAKVLDVSGLIADWCKGVKQYAEHQVKELGAKIPGYKLVIKKGRRAWVDESVVENEFAHEYGDDIYDKKLKSPAQMEKIVGKDRVSELVGVPETGVELVRDSAKGDAVLSAPGQVFDVISE